MPISSFYKRNKDVISEIIYNIIIPAVATGLVFYYLAKNDPHTSHNSSKPTSQPIKTQPSDSQRKITPSGIESALLNLDNLEKEI